MLGTITSMNNLVRTATTKQKCFSRTFITAVSSSSSSSSFLVPNDASRPITRHEQYQAQQQQQPQSFSQQQQQQQQRRWFADHIEVEHGRGKWKTYGDVENYKPGRYQIKTFNKISTVGLSRFPKDNYDILGTTTTTTTTTTPAETKTSSSSKEDSSTTSGTAQFAHAILLRSHKLQEDEVSPAVRAIARCGAGTNNIPVARMTELGIPVFNTPGANANAVKELILCGMLLGSRRIVDGINHMKTLGEQGLAKERVEKDKAMFGGHELKGKTLAIIGLGHIGSITAADAHELGMALKGYDPGLSVQSALKLPKSLTLTDSIASAVCDADYVSINIPYIKGNGGTHGIISSDVLGHMKNGTVLLNFARGELVDSAALKQYLDDHDHSRYVSDFPDDVVWNHKNAILLPHLGASTIEAEDCAAAMAAETIRDFLETGTIRNSVNFPSTSLPESPGGTVRFTVVNRNVPGCLAAITDAFGTEDLNIVQQINQSRGDIAYNVLDIDTTSHEDVLSFKTVQEKITMLPGVLSSRVIYGLPGTGYAKNIEGEYFV